jgi:hypothetical protein
MAKKKAAKKVSAPPADEKLSHSQFRKGGVISLFLGGFCSEDELDDYLSDTFPIDFGFEIDARDGPEAYVSPDSHCPIGELLKGFSQSGEFADAVVKPLAKDGWHRSGAAVIFYNFSYDPKVYPLYNAFGKLKFMGTYLLAERQWCRYR